MQFRWVALLALWTLLIGPVFNVASPPQPRGPVPGASHRGCAAAFHLDPRAGSIDGRPNPV